MDINDIKTESKDRTDVWAKGLLEMLERDKDYYKNMKEAFHGQRPVRCRKDV